MKKKILLLMGIFSVGIALHAQVGINTQNPQGIFHIDGTGNTNGINNTIDDLIIKPDATGVSVSIGGLPTTSASLALQAGNKAFLPNKVVLQDQFDLTTISPLRDGMIVYNTAYSGVEPANVTPGYYMYKSGIWIRLLTSTYSRFVKTLGLQNNIATKTSSLGNFSGATEMNFGNLTILESGSYAFTFQLSGYTDTSAKYLEGAVYHIYLLKRGFNESEYSIADYSQITVPVYGSGENVTTSLILGYSAKVGDALMIKIGHDIASSRTWTLVKNSTSMLYWKL